MRCNKFDNWLSNKYSFYDVYRIFDGVDNVYCWVFFKRTKNFGTVICCSLENDYNNRHFPLYCQVNGIICPKEGFTPIIAIKRAKCTWKTFKYLMVNVYNDFRQIWSHTSRENDIMSTFILKIKLRKKR